ncbi:MAG TPA: phage protease [Nevskiales bacterium]|nr:phage protease [Nevskiales bacterium]
MLPPPAQGAVPTFVQVIPPPGADGIVRGADGRSWRMPDPAKVAANFDKPIPIDINHAQELVAPKGGDAPATGWIEELIAQNGGVWAKVRWTEKGAELVKSLAYRYLSPVFTYLKGTGEIVRITSAALVNQPNFNLALNSAHPSQETEDMNPILKALLQMLNLKDDATEEQAVNALKSLQSELATARNSAEHPSLDKFVPRADYNQAVERATNAEQQLQTMKDAQRDAEIETVVGDALKAGKITPATKDYYTAMCRKEGGLEEFKKFVAAAPVIGSDTDLDRKREDKAKALNGAAADIAAAFGNSPEDLHKYAA